MRMGKFNLKSASGLLYCWFYPGGMAAWADMTNNEP